MTLLLQSGEIMVIRMHVGTRKFVLREGIYVNITPRFDRKVLVRYRGLHVSYILS